MPSQRHTRPPRSRAAVPVVPVPAETLAEIKEGLGKASEARHADKDREQIRAAIADAVDRAVSRIAPPATGKLADVPVWLKVLGAVTGVTLAGLGVVGIVWNFAIAPVNVRLAALEVAKTETAASLAAIVARLQASDAKVVELFTRVDTATTIRNQQQQAFTDRLRGLEMSDQAGAQQINALAQSLAGLVARVEEMLRRQERLENRLSGSLPRPGAEEAPAIFTPPERNI